MSPDLKVLFITPEVVPFSKTGGLADVSGALPVELSRLGVEIKVVTPFYRQCSEYFISQRKKPITAVDSAKLWLGGRLQRYRVLKANLPRSKVDVYFLDFPALYGRDSLYHEHGEDYWDNFFRFAFLSKAALELSRNIGFNPDIVHSNDWQSALAPVYLKTNYAGDPVLGGARSILTIHNLAYQGIFDKGFLDSGDLKSTLFHSGALEFWGKINVLKGGIVFSDAVNTVSKTYAKEIQTKEFGYGLDGVLSTSGGKISGILNGIDYSVWNPELDEHIPANYSVEDQLGKMKCKLALQEKLSLPLDENVFVLATIGRLADQKGFDLIRAGFDELLKLNMQFIILGTGMPEYHRFFEYKAARHPDMISANLFFDEELAHLIEAGADGFLMPSRFEPCGLNQLYSLRYGTIPIVRTTGGLKDTIVNATNQSIDSGKATGFGFKNYHERAMLKAIKAALNLYYDDPAVWQGLMVNAMSRDFSWTSSAQQYLKLYSKTSLAKPE